MEQQDLQAFFDKIQSDPGDFFLRFCSAIRAGNNRLHHTVVSQAITLDEGWIDTLEQAIFSVENVVHKPRRFMIDEEILVDVERAKRITPKTVRHLSSNSQFIQSIEPNGDVRPKKLLTTEMNEDLAIYENRFVCTLVHHLVAFVEKRYQDVTGKLRAFDQTSTGMISSFRFRGAECELKIDYSIREKPRNRVLLQKNEQTLERIRQLRARLRVLLNTDFVKELSAKKPVYPPIMKTNLIKMNVDYNNCYKLWLYISSYRMVGFSVAYQDKNLPVSSDFYDDLTMVCAMSFQALFLDHVLNGSRYTRVPFSPMKEKDYRALTVYKFLPEFRADKTVAGDETVNEFYFKALRDELIRATRRGEVLVEEKTLQQTFLRFCRAVGKINGQMYDDVIRQQIDPKGIAQRELTTLRRREEAVKKQKEFLKRYRQLSLIKREELEKALRREAREQLKLEKLQTALDEERGRQKAIRARKKKQKERQERILRKSEIATVNAKEYEDALREKEAERQAAIEERKRIRREEATRRRELTLLEHLKEKYDGETTAQPAAGTTGTAATTETGTGDGNA